MSRMKLTPWPESRFDITMWFHPAWWDDAKQVDIDAAIAIAWKRWPEARDVINGGRAIGVRIVGDSDDLVMDVIGRKGAFAAELAALRRAA